MMRQQWLVFVPVTLATAGLAACASVLGGEQVKIRPVDTMQTLTTAPRDSLYESAVSAINERDYGRALEYLQAAKAKDPRNVKALNALGVVYDKLGRFDLSARYYAQARAVEPDSRIVAENMGYSRVLQRLLNPNQPIAVATIDLPPGLTNPASPAGATPPPAAAGQTVAAATTVSAVPVLPVTEKKVIDASPPMVTASPLTLPDTRPLFASTIYSEPMAPVVERKLIDTPPPTVTAMSLELPDAKRVFADVSLPEPVMPVTEKKLIDTPPPTVVAVFQPLDARRLFADVTLPEPVMPVTEKKLIDAPPPTVMAVFQPLDAKRVFADVTLPEPVMPVTEKKLIDAPAPTVMAAPFVLPDAKPLFAALSPAVLSLPVSGRDGAPLAEPTASAAIMTVALSPARSVAAPANFPAPATLAIPAVAQKTVAQSAHSAGRLPAAAPSKPAIAATRISVSSVPPPQADTKRTAAAVPAVLAAPPKPAAKPVVVATAIPAAPLSAKPAVVAPVRPTVVAPVKRTVEKPITVASVSARPAVPVLPARQLAPAAPVKQLAVKTVPAKAKVLIIGQPIKLVNASGKLGGAGTVLRRLTTLGWTMRPADSRSQPATMLFYPVQNLAAAKAMQRTLPFPVRLVAESGKSAGMRLVIGRDYLSWKPRNARIAVLWQKRMIIASSQKLPLRGVR